MKVARKEGFVTMKADEIGRGDRSRLARGDRLQNEKRTVADFVHGLLLGPIELPV